MANRHARRALIAAALAATALLAAPLRAQAAKDQFFDPKNEADHYENHLKLTPEQKEKVLELMKQKLAVFKSAAAERERISRETNALAQRIRQLSKQLEGVAKKQNDGEEAVADKMRDLLDDDQKKKFDAMRELQLRQQREFEATHQGGQGGPDGGPGGPEGGPR